MILSFLLRPPSLLPTVFIASPSFWPHSVVKAQHSGLSSAFTQSVTRPASSGDQEIFSVAFSTALLR